MVLNRFGASGHNGPVTTPGPSKKGYAIAAVLVAIGAIGGIVLIVVGALAVASVNPSDFPRARANHSLKIDFEHAGGYVAYYEAPEVGNSIDSDVEVPSFSLTITAPDHAKVATQAYTSSLTYNRGGHHGIAAKTFHIDHAGIYTFKVGSLPGGSDARVAFGKSTAGATVGGAALVIAGIFGGGFLVLVGLIVLLITFIRRRNSANRLMAAPTNYEAPAYGAPAYGAPAATQPPPGPPGPSYGGPAAAPPPPSPGPPPPPSPGPPPPPSPGPPPPPPPSPSPGTAQP